MNATTEIQFHPLAEIFPLMEGAEFDALVADIKANGLRVPITLYDGKILDGRNRYRACVKAGIEPIGPSTRNHHAGCDYIGDPAAFVISANIHRRHLTAEQKRELIAKLIKAQPEKSDRQIAATAKTSPTTVGKVRSEIKPTVQSGQLKRIGKDGKARRVPRAGRAGSPNARAAAVNAAALQRRREHAGAIARELIQEFGEMTVRRIAEALCDPYVEEALAALFGNKGTTRIERDREECVRLFAKVTASETELAQFKADHPAASEAIANDDGLDIPESLRRDKAVSS